MTKQCHQIRKAKVLMEQVLGFDNSTQRINVTEVMMLLIIIILEAQSCLTEEEERTLKTNEAQISCF